MATGDKFVSIQPKRLMGFQDFRERFLDYFKKVFEDITENAFGQNGFFNTNVAMSAFGNDRIQLDNDVPGTDAAGHFMITSADLAGRTSGIEVENTNTIVYYVALNYAERPRGVQINPRTGIPEFLEIEETIGIRDVPDAVVDHGDGTMTFTVNSVARPFAADVSNNLDQTGRTVVVWKKTPGKTAVSEGLAILSGTIALASGDNKVTVGTVGIDPFGQIPGSASTLAADYFVLLLGPTVSRQDLSVEPNTLFVGQFTGTGSGNPPGTFNISGQNLLGPVAADLGQVTEAHHGNLKLRTIADASDSNETQLEARDTAGNNVFGVDEVGRAYFGSKGAGGKPDTGTVLETIGTLLNSLRGPVAFGSDIGGLSQPTASATARLSHTNFLSNWINLLNINTGGTPMNVWQDSSNVRWGITINCNYQQATNTWIKTQSPFPAYLIEFRNDAVNPGHLFLKTRFGSTGLGPWDNDDNGGGGSKWDHVVNWQLPDELARESRLLGLCSSELRGATGGISPAAAILRLGEDSEADVTSGHNHPRVRADAMASGGQAHVAIWESRPGAGATSDGISRVFACQTGGYVHTTNANFGTVSGSWTKDVTTKAATRIDLIGGNIRLATREADLVAAFTDVGWKDVQLIDGVNFTSGAGLGAATSTYRGILQVLRRFDRLGENLLDTDANGILPRVHISGDVVAQGGTADFVGIERVKPDTGEAGWTRYFGTGIGIGTSIYEELWNAVRDPANVFNSLRDSATYASLRKAVVPATATSVETEIQTRGGAQSSPWGPTLWRTVGRLFHYSEDAVGLVSGGALIAQIRKGAAFFIGTTPSTTEDQTNPNPTTNAGTNFVIAKNQIKAWVFFEVPATAGSTRTILDGCNIASVTQSGLHTRIQIHPSMNSATLLAPMISHVSGFNTDNLTWQSLIAQHNANRIDVSLTQDSVLLDQGNLTEAVRCMVIFLGTDDS